MSAADEVLATARENPYGIEVLGVEPIPPELRHGGPRSLFTLWFGANTQFATLSVGALSTAVFGLDLVPAILAIVLGTLISSVLVGVLSTRGPATGLPQLIQTRGPFGWFGNLPAVVSTAVGGIGWYVVDTTLGIFILRDLLDIGFTPSLLIMVVAQLIVPLIGYRLIHAMEKWLATGLVCVFAVVTAYATGQVSLTTATHPAGSVVGAFLLTVSVTGARGLGWAAYASDYSRYLPAGTSSRRVFAAAAGGSIVSGVWIGGLGAALGTVAAVADPSSMVRQFLPSIFGTVVLVSLLLSTLASTVLDLHSGSMAALAAGVRIPRWASVVLVCLIGSVLAWWAGQHDFVSTFQNFLLITSYWLAPWAAVTVTAFFRRGRTVATAVELSDRRRRFGWGLPATVLGVLASIPFMSQSVYTGPIAAAHPDIAGLGHVIGCTVAVLAYIAVTALDQERVPA
ncbi:purine-cytosine permease family protein [Nocardia sp. NBC_01327]|uniref:purine-cytosine permease family protein n=1 Tax=Nocardia sp. NBC_01327 TaxID=2903593 RepID=UPI002E13DAA0|nr:cytosine permease [Nocardia sp. NBC_01327]